MTAPTPLTDEDREKLSDKRGQHLRPESKKLEFIPSQPIWFTDDNSDEWQAGFIESKDVHPNSWWIVNTGDNRRIHCNQADLKPRVLLAAEQRPKEPTQLTVLPLQPQQQQPDQDLVAAPPPPAALSPPMANQTSVPTLQQAPPPPRWMTPTRAPPVQPTTTISSRTVKPTTNPDFVYTKK